MPYAFPTYTVMNENQRHRSSQEIDNVPREVTVIGERKMNYGFPGA